MLIDATICGIPAKVRVIYSHYTRPDPGTWDSDIDYYGGWELDYEVCDRRGRKADWLCRKLNAADFAQIEQQIIEHLEAQ